MVDQRLEVAVWWPGEGYGSPTRVDSVEEAEHKADILRRMGYGDGKTEIHLIRTARTVTKLCGTKEARK